MYQNDWKTATVVTVAEQWTPTHMTYARTKRIKLVRKVLSRLDFFSFFNFSSINFVFFYLYRQIDSSRVDPQSIVDVRNHLLSHLKFWLHLNFWQPLSSHHRFDAEYRLPRKATSESWALGVHGTVQRMRNWCQCINCCHCLRSTWIDFNYAVSVYVWMCGRCVFDSLARHISNDYLLIQLMHGANAIISLRLKRRMGRSSSPIHFIEFLILSAVRSLSLTLSVSQLQLPLIHVSHNHKTHDEFSQQ